MKKFLALTMALAMSLSLAACGPKDRSNNSASNPGSASADGSTPAGSYGEFTTIEEGKLVLSTNAEFPPYEMLDDAGNPIGIDMEVAAAIADKLGLELDIIDTGFDAALLAVQNGQSDIAMAGITVTEDRLQVMDFSESYATGVQVVIVKEDSAIQSIDDLANADKIGTQLGTTGYIYASDTPENGGYGEDHVIGYETGAVAVQNLVNGQIDAVIIDDKPAQAYVEANPGLKILEGEWAVEDYAIGFAKGNTQLIEAVNAVMAELKADGTFQQIVDKYITAD